MEQLPLWLSALPKEMQGSLMTIAGSAITALFGGIGWLAKTWNDRSKERTKRQMEMRRDIFMPAAESIIEAMAFAGALAGDMRPDAEIQAEFVKHARKIAPIQVVGSDATVHASGEFAAKFTTFFMAAMALRQQVRQAHVAGHFAPSLEEKAKWSETAAAYSNQSLAEMLKQHLKPVQLAHGALMLEMRKELGLKTNRKRYRQTLDSVEKQVMASYDEFRGNVFSKAKQDSPPTDQ